ASPTAGAAPLLRLAQRLPSAFQLRLVDDPVDAQYPSAHLVGDGEAYYFRPSGHRYDDGETWLLGAARSRQIEQEFLQVWERSAAWTGHRALGL
ncbi:GNAT family N-acetyltransferase, partial [Xanthomonas sp. Kuri4-1]